MAKEKAHFVTWNKENTAEVSLKQTQLRRHSDQGRYGDYAAKILDNTDRYAHHTSYKENTRIPYPRTDIYPLLPESNKDKITFCIAESSHNMHI
jgi:hypothetical protein